MELDVCCSYDYIFLRDGRRILVTGMGGSIRGRESRLGCAVPSHPAKRY